MDVSGHKNNHIRIYSEGIGVTYKKIIINGYIVGVGRLLCDGAAGDLTEEEYTAICRIIAEKPSDPEGYYYRLKNDLTWELCELPAVTIEDPELTAEESLDIITGGAK